MNYSIVMWQPEHTCLAYLYLRVHYYSRKYLSQYHVVVVYELSEFYTKVHNLAYFMC